MKTISNHLNKKNIKEIDNKRINIGPENTDEFWFGKSIIDNLKDKHKIFPKFKFPFHSSHIN